MHSKRHWTNQPRSMFGGDLAPFKEAQPEITALKVTVRQEGHYPVEPNLKNYGYTLEHPPGEWVSCGNPRCTGRTADTGRGFAIGKQIWMMSKNRETRKEGVALCQGREGRTPSAGPCLCGYRFAIEIDYLDVARKPHGTTSNPPPDPSRAPLR